MSRIALVLLVGLAVGCGKDEKPRVGSNNSRSNNNDSEDMGRISIFPDVTIVDDSGPDDRPDMRVQDLGADMPAVEEDMSVIDLGTDAGVDMGVDMGPDCPRMNVTKGGACKCNQECTTGVCADATVDIDGFCTDGCTSTGDCPAGEACAMDRFGAGFCRTDDTGATCTNAGQADPTMCAQSRCVEAGSNFPLDYFCSVECDSSSECKTGHACTPVHCQYDPQSGYRCIPDIIISRQGSTEKAQTLAAFTEATKMCTRVGEPNPCGSATMASDQEACAGAVCDAVPTGRCSAGCSVTADCPVGGCIDYDVSDPNLPVRVCDI